MAWCRLYTRVIRSDNVPVLAVAGLDDRPGLGREDAEVGEERRDEMRRLGLIIVFLCLAAAKPATERKSADGLLLPPAEPEKKLKANLPLIREAIGSRPEELGRVLNAKKSADVIAKKMPGPMWGDWVVLSAFGSDAAGLTLTDGRVTRIDLYYRTWTAAKEKTILADFAKLGKPVPGRSGAYLIEVNGVRITADISGSVTFIVNGVDWHLLYHEVPEPIAKAMKAGKIIKGMSLAQANLAMNQPPTVQRDHGEAVDYEWIFAEGTAGEIGAVVPPGRVVRHVYATLRNDRVTTVRDDSLVNP